MVFPIIMTGSSLGNKSMQNVEYKCELRDIDLVRGIIKRIGGRHVFTVKQRDTYYKLFQGRLKKRETEAPPNEPPAPTEPPEWIHYHRQDRLSSKLSHFSILDEDEARQRFGQRDMPVWVVVEKTRELWMCGSVRVHLDDVKGLGKFLEIEALVTPRRHIGRCHRLVRALLAKFGPTLGEPISVSYSDMVAAEIEHAGGGRGRRG